MERLCVKYYCENCENNSCDFSYMALLTFIGSNIMPKQHFELAKYILDRKNDNKIKRYMKKRLSDNYEKNFFIESSYSKLEKAREVVDSIGMDNIIYALLLLDIGYYCPECHKFQSQVEFVMNYNNKMGKEQIYSFEHKCNNCGRNLVKLTGSSKQLSKLLCPKCGGRIKIDNSSIVNVVVPFSLKK